MGERERGAERGDEPRTHERLRERAARSDDANAFIPDPEDGRAVIPDDLAETLAEEFVRSATTGEDTGDEALDVVVPEELGGPFVETSASEEFALGTDGSNPEDATSEPLPRAVGGPSDDEGR